MPLTFEPVTTPAQIKETAKLAEKIWNEHFPKIIGQDQTDYMVEKFQSAQAIANQIGSGYEYFQIKKEGCAVGYTAIEKQNGSLFLSKLYVRKQNRGEHIATEAIAFLKEICAENNLSKIWLTVNRNNTNTIEIYKHLGFEIVRTQAADIGCGFVMDDYIMEIVFDNKC
ncbi:MAG: GNAT family N-acetyltransferase [Methanocorpusculum sp.]|nr:GNAT family N-acetyltransferase [Methanocorpusculum sp.]